MLRPLRRRLCAWLTALVACGGLSLTAAPPAQAIIGGSPDTSDTYPYVGMVTAYDSSGQYRCSGVLVSPRVVLTAAHCTVAVVGKTLVNFHALLADQNFTTRPRAANPSLGFSGAEGAADGYHSGTAYSHPGFTGALGDKSVDAGVVVLDQPVTTVSPAPLAPKDYLRRMAQPVLAKTLFTVVGYGAYLGPAPQGGGKPTLQDTIIRRNHATTKGSQVTSATLRMQGNPNDKTGTGTMCFGDSGGPVFSPGGLVVGVVSFGHTPDCRWSSSAQRSDTSTVLTWLAGFGVTPNAG